MWLVAVGMRQQGWLACVAPALGWFLLCSAGTAFMTASGIGFRLARALGVKLKPWARELEDQRASDFSRIASD
jgi:hypothetical protein